MSILQRCKSFPLEELIKFRECDSPEKIREVFDLLNANQDTLINIIHNFVLISNTKDKISEKLTHELLDLIPEDSPDIFWGIASSLVNHGMYIGHLHTSSLRDYGINDFTQLRRKITKVAEAWKDIATFYAGKVYGEDEFEISCILK